MARLDKVTFHLRNQRGRTSESGCPEGEEILYEVAYVHGRWCVRGLHRRYRIRRTYAWGLPCARTMARNFGASRLAPPTRTPSISGCWLNSAAFAGVTLPPYRMRAC